MHTSITVAEKVTAEAPAAVTVLGRPEIREQPGINIDDRLRSVPGFSLFRQVILPGALPSILVGVRFALGFMWLTLIVAETISANAGIGYLAMNAREFLHTDVVVLAIVLYAVLGKLADLAARGLERVWLRWHPAYQVARKEGA